MATRNTRLLTTDGRRWTRMGRKRNVWGRGDDGGWFGVFFSLWAWFAESGGQITFMSWNSKEPRWHGGKEPKGKPLFFVIHSQECARVPYGEHPDDLHFPKCDDCGVPRGQLHQLGCD